MGGDDDRTAVGGGAATGAWSRYWATGAAHSCAGSFDRVYGGAIAAVWKAAFDALPPAAKVLDLACGNGALARLLLEHRPDPGLHCDAVDAADVDPAWSHREPRVRFWPRTSADALPFADGRFDLVASQYGLEYADTDRALSEALRVTRADGTVLLVSHRTDGRPCTLARVELEHVAWLTASDGWLAAAAAMTEPMSMVGQPDGPQRLRADPRFGRIRARFDALTEQAVALRASSACGDLIDDVRTWTADAFRVSATSGRRDGLAAVERIAALLEDVRLRLNDLLAHALDASDVERLRALAAERGWMLEDRPLVDRGHVMGVIVRVVRRQHDGIRAARDR